MLPSAACSPWEPEPQSGASALLSSGVPDGALLVAQGAASGVAVVEEPVLAVVGVVEEPVRVAVDDGVSSVQALSIRAVPASRVSGTTGLRRCIVASF